MDSTPVGWQAIMPAPEKAAMKKGRNGPKKDSPAAYERNRRVFRVNLWSEAYALSAEAAGAAV